MAQTKRTIHHDVPIEALSALRLSPDEFAREMRLAACVQWFREGVLSQGKAAEISGLGRSDFLRELSRRHVDILQVDDQELDEELRWIREARR